jgi:hypothetical protein
VYQNTIAVAKPTIVATGHREKYLSGYPPPTTIPGKLLRHPRNPVTIKFFSPSILFATEIHFSLILLHN